LQGRVRTAEGRSGSLGMHMDERRLSAMMVRRTRTMRRRHVMAAMFMGGMLVAGTAVHGQQQPARGCAKIAAALDDHPGLSAEEIAKRTSTDIETVRGCVDSWRATIKRSGPKDAPAAAPPMAPGCAKIVAAFEANSGLSADEVAKKTSTDVQT